METVKEKLIKLLAEAEEYERKECEKYVVCLGCPSGGKECGYMHMTDYLIHNGVTIQEWVSVDERLPEESLNSVLGWDQYRERCVFVRYYKGEWILGDFLPVKIIAWMPLPLCPQPPKEVQ